MKSRNIGVSNLISYNFLQESNMMFTYSLPGVDGVNGNGNAQWGIFKNYRVLNY